MAGPLDSVYNSLTDIQGHVAGINPSGTLSVAPVDGKKNTYSIGTQNITVPASATDIVTISGSTTKLVKVLKVEITGTQTTAGQVLIILIIHRTPNSGGTFTNYNTSNFLFGQDSNNPAPTATVLVYSVNPASLGSPNTNYRVSQMFVPATASLTAPSLLRWDFGNRPGQAITLRGPNDVLGINLNAATIVGGNFWVNLEWTEE